MAEKVGVLVVSYGSRAASIVDALCRSQKYDVQIFDADKQLNPFIVERATACEVTGDDPRKICDFAAKHKDEIDFGVVGPEGAIINGVRDLVEAETGIPMICPTKQYAIEVSKVQQRLLLDEVFPDANPRFQVFNQEQDGSAQEAKKKVWDWLDQLENQAVVKPDLPATGKGVGVWGDHFQTREDLWEHFVSIYNTGTKVIIEEKVDGEEYSLQFFSDGKHLISTPAVRDYKRAFDNDLGPNTGGMGSYKDAGNLLPFMSESDWEQGLEIGRKVFDRMREGGNELGLRGIPLYMAYICTSEGVKFLEINSRPGDPEIMNIMPIIKDDFIDICYRMIEGTFTKLELEAKATVVTYAVPMTYGGCRDSYTGDTRVKLDALKEIMQRQEGNLRAYTGSMELRENGEIHVLKSRAIAMVGIAEDIQGAREKSLKGIRAIDGALWARWDIASPEHIGKSIEHMKHLRG